MKPEIKNAILEMLSDGKAATPNCNTAEDFIWVFDYVKANISSRRRYAYRVCEPCDCVAW